MLCISCQYLAWKPSLRLAAGCTLSFSRTGIRPTLYISSLFVDKPESMFNNSSDWYMHSLGFSTSSSPKHSIKCGMARVPTWCFWSLRLAHNCFKAKMVLLDKMVPNSTVVKMYSRHFTVWGYMSLVPNRSRRIGARWPNFLWPVLQTRCNELLSKAVVVAELANDNAGLGQEPFLGNAAQGCTLYALALLGGGSHLRVGRGEYVIEQGNETCAGNDTPVVWLFGQVDQKHHRVVAQVVILSWLPNGPKLKGPNTLEVGTKAVKRIHNKHRVW